VLADINLLNVGGTLSKFVFLCQVCFDLTQTRVKLRVKKRKFVSNRHKYLCLCVFGNAPITVTVSLFLGGYTKNKVPGARNWKRECWDRAQKMARKSTVEVP